MCHGVIVILSAILQGAHVTINARSEMDLEEDCILGKVAKASGANFSFHKEKAKPMPEAGPVVSWSLSSSSRLILLAVWCRGQCSRRRTQEQTLMRGPEISSGSSKR